MASVVSSLRILLADFIGDKNATRPVLPDGLPASVIPVAEQAIATLTDYQSTGYAQLYADRLKRFVGRSGVDDAMLADIARLMAARMSYEDPIRIAQLKLAGFVTGNPPSAPSEEFRKFRLDELIGALPGMAAEPVLDGLEWMGWLHKPLSIRFSTASRWGLRRLKIESFLRRWRLFSVRYGKEMMWVERWLHMIDRSLVKQPAAVAAVVATADMIEGYGDGYRQGLADWHTIIDGLVKPVVYGEITLPDLADAITQARRSALPDSRQAALKQTIAEIRARAL